MADDKTSNEPPATEPEPVVELEPEPSWPDVTEIETRTGDRGDFPLKRDH